MRKNSYRDYLEKMDRWNKHDSGFNRLVIGFNYRSIKYYESGVNIWVTLNSHYSYEKQVRMVQEKKEGIVKYIIEEISIREGKVYKKALSIIKCSNLDSMTVTRRNELCITFELKDKIKSILEENENA